MENPLGELYSRFWGRWLARLRRRLEQGGPASDILSHTAFLERYGCEKGAIPLFREAYRLSLEEAFEPVSFALLDAGSEAAFVERWQEILDLQGRRLSLDLIRYQAGAFHLLPSASPQASGSLAGPTILAAATLGLLMPPRAGQFRNRLADAGSMAGRIPGI